MVRRFRPGRGVCGQATVETVLLTWLLVVIFMAALQLFVANRSALTATITAHSTMFGTSLAANNAGTPCNTDLNGKVIWNVAAVPAVRIPLLSLFRWAAAGSREIYIRSNARGLEPSKGCLLFPCKKTKMAVGTSVNANRLRPGTEFSACGSAGE